MAIPEPTDYSYFADNKMNGPSCSSMVDEYRLEKLTRDQRAPIWTPFAAHNMAPWVKVWFIGTKFCISVGNSSQPGGAVSNGKSASDLGCKDGIPQREECGGQSYNTQSMKNHCMITNFQYGCSGGRTNGSDGIKLEVLDEEGGDFCNFMINIFPKSRDKGKPAQECKMAFQFGWILTDCYGKECVKAMSRKRVCYPLQVDVSFVGGLIKFSISACNPTEVLMEGPSNIVDAYKEPVKKAIKKLFSAYNMDALFLTSDSTAKCGGGGCPGRLERCDPKFAPVEYVDRENFKEWKIAWEDDSCDGNIPGNEAYKTHNKDPISAAMTWLQDKVTDSKDKKGFVVGSCNIAGKKPTIIFWESPLPNCQGINATIKNIGTYIVNGGKCSSVLSFNPQINWQVANMNQGGNTSEMTAEAIRAKPRCELTGSGNGERLVVEDTSTEIHHANALKRVEVAHAANARALPPAAAIEAELVIQGNPYLDDPLLLSAGSECSIIVINPFTLHPDVNKTNSAACSMDWLADPPMNRFLSNKHWLIQGVSHEIKEGSFTTTLKVWLATPGVDINYNAPLGGPPGPILKKTK